MTKLLMSGLRFRGQSLIPQTIPTVDYANAVQGIANLVAYWRFTDDTGIDDIVGSLNGTYDAAITEVGGLPANSDGAIRLGGLARGTVPTDASLDVAAGTLSFWMSIHEENSEFRAVIAREQSGLNDGDFACYWVEREFYAQFQNAGGQHKIVGEISMDTPHHVVVTADSSGFELWIDGRHQGTNTDHTTAWTNNANDLVVGSAQHLTDELDCTIDEVAFYNRVLTDAEIITLSQRLGLPVATGDSFQVTESTTGILNVVGNDEWVGRLTGLTVEVVTNGSFGTATVRGDKDIDFAADAVTVNEADSFTYRITDDNGVSNTETVDVLVLDSADAGGGTLVYSWEPQDAWIDGVAFANRNADDVLDPAKWDDSAGSGASVGGALFINDFKTGGGQRVCFNYCPPAPSGTRMGENIPCLEIAMPEDLTNSNASIAVRLYNALDGTAPRHMRIVFEVKTSKSTDDTTHKANGHTSIPSGDPYRDYRDSHEDWDGNHTNIAQKYFIGVWGGNNPAGGLRENHWENPDERIDTYSDRWQPGANGKSPIVYSYGFNRISNAGGWPDNTPSTPQDEDGNTASVSDVGIHGVWHRIETEVFLCTPSLSEAADARRKDPPASSRPEGGDGFVKHYWTKDIDNELGGGVGTRVLLITGNNMIQNCWRDDVGSFDDMHTLLGLVGPWIYHDYGGPQECQRDAFGWIRKIEVYQHD